MAACKMSDNLCNCLNKINDLIKSQTEANLVVSEDYFFQAWDENAAIKKN